MLVRCLLIAATGDEVLDYRQVVAKYAGYEQIVIGGGDHGLSHFVDCPEVVLAYCEAARQPS